MTSDDTKTPKLPKPVTVTGSSFPDPDPQVDDQVEETAENNEEILPMPAALDADDDEDIAPVVKKNDVPEQKTEAPLDNLLPKIGSDNHLPKIESASSDPAIHTIQTTASATDQGNVQVKTDDIALPPLPSLSPEEANLSDIHAFTAPHNSPAITQTPDSSDIDKPLTDSANTAFINTFNADQTPNKSTSDDLAFDLPQLDVNKVPAEVSALNGNQPETYSQPSTSAIPDYKPEPVQSFDSQTDMVTPPQSSNNLNKTLLGIGIFLIGGGLVVGGYFGITKLKGNSSGKTPTIAYQEPTFSPRPIQSPATGTEATASATPAASPKTAPKTTPKSTAKTASKPSTSDGIKVQILNGSGIKGEALKVKALLPSNTYDISTGNADNFDYTGITVEYKEKYETEAGNVAKSLESAYGKATLEGALKDSDDYDVIITVGSVTAKASPSPTPKS